MFAVWDHNKKYLEEYYRHAGHNNIVTIDDQACRYDVGFWPEVDTLIWRRCNLPLLPFLAPNRFPNLERLECRETGQRTLAFLRECPRLRILECGGNHLTSLRGLEFSPDIWILGCADNQLTSLDGIQPLTNLSELHCDRNQITSLEPARGMMNLWNLSVTGNPLC